MLGLTQAFGLGQAKSGLTPMLPQEALEEYKILYKKRFGVELTNDEAALRANNLVNLYKAVYGALPVEIGGTPHDQI